MVFKQTGTFIGYESYYQKDEGGGMKSRWLFGGRPSLILDSLVKTRFEEVPAF